MKRNRYTDLYSPAMKQEISKLFSEGVPAKTLALKYEVSLSSIRDWTVGVYVQKEANISVLENERWYPYKDYEGLYELSNFGRVKSLPRVGNQYTTRIVVEKISKFGYPCVMLYKNGGYAGRTIHRMMAIMFIPNPNNLPTVNHKNGIKTDYRVENLEWTTKRDDIIHAFATGLHVRKKGSQNPHAKKTGQFNERGEMLKEYGCLKEVSTDGFASNNVWKAIKNNKFYKGYYWKYI